MKSGHRQATQSLGDKEQGAPTDSLQFGTYIHLACTGGQAGLSERGVPGPPGCLRDEDGSDPCQQMQWMLQVYSSSNRRPAYGREAHRRHLNTGMVASTPCPWPPLTLGQGGRASGHTWLWMAQQQQC